MGTEHSESEKSEKRDRDVKPREEGGDPKTRDVDEEDREDEYVDPLVRREQHERHQPHPHEGHHGEGIGSAGGPPLENRPVNQPHEPEQPKHEKGTRGGRRSTRVHPQRFDNQTPYDAL